MKHIVMVLGIGINERGWARLLSKFGRVTLIQLDPLEHVEVWEHERLLDSGPENQPPRFRKLDKEFFLGLFMLFRTIRLVRRYSQKSKIDVLLAGFHNSGLAALWLRRKGEVRTVVAFLADYLPPKGSWLTRIHRRVTGWLTQWVAQKSDEAWALSPRIAAARANPKCFVVPIFVTDNHTPAGPREEVAYIGFPSPDHALDILFDICKKHSFRLNVIGDSSYLQSIKPFAPPGTVFHGLLNDEEKIGKILSRCFCGYAIYRNTGPTSYSYYGFPSKTLYCFANNVPVVITNVAYFNGEFEKRGVGRVVEPVTEEIEKAMLELKARYETYSQAIARFRTEWNVGVETFHRERMAELLNK